MLLEETELLEKFRNAKRVQLIEPQYPRKYPPLGLAKIATYLKQHNVEFIYTRTPKPGKYDLICVASLFTYYSSDVFNTLNQLAFLQAGTPIVIGGVLASLMPDVLQEKYPKIMIFKGYSKVLDQCIPANLDYHLEEPWNDFSFVFTSRGCPNKCLSGDTLVNTVKGDIPIKDLVKKRIGVYTYSPETKEVFITKAIHIREMGVKKLVRVHFDDGTHIDCTPDHKFLTFTQGNQVALSVEIEKEAKDLFPNESVRALKITTMPQGYIVVNWGRRKRQLQHRMVMEYKLGRKLKRGEVVHHKDHIKSHNLPKNLKLSANMKEHFKHHPGISERMRNDNPSKYCTEESHRKVGAAIKGQKRSLETRLKHRENKLGKNNPNYKHGKTAGQQSRIAEINHKVVRVEPIGKEMTYDMEVPATNWFFANNVLVHNCGYCTVWRIEKERWVNPTWEDHINLSKPNIMISDNNLSAVTDEHLKGIVDFAVKHKKGILFDNGFDCKYITEPMAKELARLKFVRNGMRMAFDRIEEDGTFQKACKILQDAGVSKNVMMAYVLFNFMDRPQDADYRCRECFKLGVRPYPQYYRPLNTMKKKDKFVGKHWTLNLGRAFRHFWLMRGLFSKTTFGEWIKTNPDHVKITKKDIEVWNNNGIKEDKKEK